MKTLWALLVVGLAEAAWANAKVRYPAADALLATENVNATITGDTAVVKGQFLFFSEPVYDRSRELSDKMIRVYFPLFGARGTNWTVQDFKFSLELNGAPPSSCAVATNAPLAVPESPAYSVVWIVTTFPDRNGLWLSYGGRRRGLRICLNVSYEQKLLDGVFYYLPIVEKTRRDTAELSITVESDRPIRSEGKDSGSRVVLGPRKLVFLPAHLGLIVVSTKPGP